MSETTSWIEVVRGDVVESRHAVHVSVARADGRFVAQLGDGSRSVFYRSAAKPFQALPLVEEGVADRLGITDAELALCCGSHEGEPEHVGAARTLLARAGVDELLLRCGAHEPFSAEASRALARDGRGPDRIHNNCSGKHAGMLALAVGMGWDPRDYHRPDHPVQRRMALEVSRWSGLPVADIATAVDGCGVPCFAVPLDVMALSFAGFAEAASREPGPGRVVRAMTGHAFMVGGTGRVCTEVMDALGGRVFVKLGAEGVYGGGIPDLGLGLAIKVEDGGRRAAEVALVHVLDQLGALGEEERRRLRAIARPPVTNTRGETVGLMRPSPSFACPPSVER